MRNDYDHRDYARGYDHHSYGVRGYQMGPGWGWRDRDELCRMLATDEYRLNVDICRARKQLAAAGLAGAASIVERRPGTGRLRLGAARVKIEREGA